MMVMTMIIINIIAAVIIVFWTNGNKSSSLEDITIKNKKIFFYTSNFEGMKALKCS